MTKESEEAFDCLVKSAQAKQVIVLYFLAVLPDGQAINVTSEMMPEDLEVVGLFPSSVGIHPLNYRKMMEKRGSKLAQIMTRTINPIARNLLEATIRKLNEPAK